MQRIARAFSLLPALALAACATSPQVSVLSADMTGPAPADVATLQAPAETTATAASQTDASAFVDPAAYSQLSAKSKSQLSTAQFNALQFGRVGAPRNWTGDNSQSGSITVGPYVRVNLIDCRDFTDTVMIAGQSFVKKGTACRGADGSWSVTATKTG
jgi:surface antigen